MFQILNPCQKINFSVQDKKHSTFVEGSIILYNSVLIFYIDSLIHSLD